MLPCTWNCSWKEANCRVTCAVSLSRFARTSLKKERKIYWFLTPQVPQMQERLTEGSQLCAERKLALCAITQGQKAIRGRSPSLSWTSSPPSPWDRARGEDATGEA